MFLLILKFRTRKYKELLTDLDNLADWMNRVEGLQSKTWLQCADSRQIGGIYHFDSWENLIAYKHSPVLLEFKQNYEITEWQELCFSTAEVDAASKKNHSPFFN